jgi:hypothetical protein
MEALRAVFSGIGRILMAADKSQRPAAGQPAAPEPRWRSLDQTGNVRLITAEDMNDSDADVTTAADGVPPLPLASYDALSLASIRARLRTLDVAQLRTLVDYEATHAERPDVLGMLERRIEKLETGG